MSRCMSLSTPHTPLRLLAAPLLALVLSACGGGEDGNGMAPPPDGSGSTPPPTAKTCQQQFDPDKLAAGEDCTPVYSEFCPEVSGTVLPGSEPQTCDGVVSSSGTVTVGDTTVTYHELVPASGEIAGTYVALHWASANGVAMIDRMRLAELAKGRQLRVVAPDAPGTISTWDVTDLGANAPRTLEDQITLLDAVIDATVPGGPIYVSGISGGAAFAYQYACARAGTLAGTLAGIQIVAADIQPEDFNACAIADSLPTVQVHGTGDLLTPYDPVTFLSAGVETVYTGLADNNGCVVDARQTASLEAPDDPLISGVDVLWNTRSGCATGKGSALVRVNGGGHNWPGYAGPLDGSLGLFGATTNAFDATLQGYDLLRYLAP